jgi:flagellar biosynthesis protein FlhF
MNLKEDNSSEVEKADSGKKFRLVVRSAEEAVRVIRDKLGENAKVLSVRQVGGTGLKRFVSSPKLEVIAHVPEEEVQVDEAEDKKLDDKVLSAAPLPPTSEVNAAPIQGKLPVKNETNIAAEEIEQGKGLYLLERTGFDPGLLKSLQSWSNWHEISKLSLAEALKEITIGLSDRFRGIQSSPTTNKVAFVGSPGSGKTTTLCKFLANEVFINKNTPNVLKLENGMPNPDDSLRIFCEVIGVTLFREENNFPSPTDQNPLYLDFPGFSLSNTNDWHEAGESLDRLGVDTRVLVVNGAYEKDIIIKEIRLARNLKATHLAITHFDEINNATKLWPILFENGLSPICICNGQNVTGDFSTNIMNLMITKTFPEELYSRGFKHFKHINQ